MMGLIERRRDHRESRIVAAEVAIVRQEWDRAWAALEDAYRENASARICALFAAVADPELLVAELARLAREAERDETRLAAIGQLLDRPLAARVRRST